MSESAKKHKQLRESFYAAAMQLIAMLAAEGKREQALFLRDKVNEMKVLESKCDFPKTEGMKVHLN